jgi:preprotein translocase subunit SecA
VPFGDGRKGINVLTNMQKTLDSNAEELCNSLEKTITLVVIDDAWKEHLRGMDDLKQSVQTAYLEQKDPLVIYKIESYNLFRNMSEELNKDIVSFLCHATIPAQQENAQLKEGRQEKTDLQNSAPTKKMLTVPAMIMLLMNAINLNPVVAVLKLPKNKHL